VDEFADGRLAKDSHFRFAVTIIFQKIRLTAVRLRPVVLIKKHARHREGHVAAGRAAKHIH
jgi:hypothetical protein